MDSNRWAMIKELFNETLDLPESERTAFLNTCDADLRGEVEQLLRADRDAGQFIDEPAIVDIGLFGELPNYSYLGTQIDSFKIVKEIGHGGMGTVYLAEHADESFTKHVALKLIKRGMDTGAVLKRFVMERRILAQLQHPNLANFIDGGSTADGLPYFVMEYVNGTPINKFADARGLSINQRIELFQKVCSAISYAHQNLVVHRDIKPSNILVTENGTPKLLDFGIAKLLHPEWSLETAEATATMFRIMTPEYASPEQIRGLPITTASDVYSLGVVLYELLSGERPYKIESRLPEEIAQHILTVEPIKPSSVVSSRFQVSSSMSERETFPNDNEQTADGEPRT
ncbi:MAG: serine/threonine protein kinase, partial [Pyrinomonadaceae bacterium]